MRRSSALAKIITIYIVLILTIFVLANTVGFVALEEVVAQNEKSRMYDEVQYVVDLYVSSYNKIVLYNESVDYDEVDRMIRLSASINGYTVFVVTDTGEVVKDTSDRAVGMNLRDENPDVLGKKYNRSISFPTFDNQQMSVMQSIFYGDDQTISGYVVVFSGIETIAAETTEYMLTVKIGIAIVAVAFLVVLIGAYAWVLYPLKKLGKQALQYSNGDYSNDQFVLVDKEFKTLSASVHYMGITLATKDESQRKFIANISHDFRSPLTNIKGYVEAMKDGTIDKDHQDKYFDILLYETDRLKKLTENLLELNKADRKEMLLDITSFDLHKMIRDIVLTFEQSCKSRKISIVLELFDDSIMVDCDKGKIQQVFYNLIDNAIKFSYNGGKIVIKTRKRRGKVYVSVKDFGVGIAKEKVGRIWERFYKADESRGKDKKGTGIGLSIVKEIISAHKETISVVSTEGYGTEFTFSLSLSEENDEE
ncbi:MAG: HAMP domain-containing histidine kinase [Lachnospiraceae bacterium]|nr:HAMP domain-containing histidine kinase [Lachnospiraceae bacterium]